jgi:hypothetical protein
MTLMDAPKFDEAGARRNKGLAIAALVAALVLALLVAGWFLGMPHSLWNYPAEHRVNAFFSAVESGDLAKAYGVWNNDANWQQHPQQYPNYTYGQFQVDWGSSSEWGPISSHKIVISKRTGSGTVVGLAVNGRKTLTFLWVEGKTHQIGFSPVELQY